MAAVAEPKQPNKVKSATKMAKNGAKKGFKWHLKYHRLFKISSRNQRPQKPPAFSPANIEALMCSEGFCLAPFRNHQNNETLASLARPPAPYQRWSDYLIEFGERRWGSDGWGSGFQYYFLRGVYDCGYGTPGYLHHCDIMEWMRRQHHSCGVCRSCVLQRQRLHDYLRDNFPTGPVFAGPRVRRNSVSQPGSPHPRNRT